MPLGPDLQHRPVVISGHRAAGPGPQRRDRDGQRVVRVVLVRVAGLQQPDPGRQLRLHVQHPLADGDELLGQQVTEPGSALHGPGPVRPRGRPRDQLLRLAKRCADPDLAQRLLARADHHRGVRPFMRVHADHHCRHQARSQVVRQKMDNVAGMPNYGSASARTSFEPHHGENRQAGTSL